MSVRLASLGLLWAMLATGCTVSEGPFPRDPRDPVEAIFIGGVHPIWHADNTVEVRGYFVNQGPDVIPLSEGSWVVSTGITLSTPDGYAPDWAAVDNIKVGDAAWASGGVLSFSHRFSEIAPNGTPLILDIVSVAAARVPRYIYPCFDENGLITSPECDFPALKDQTYVYPWTEPRYFPRTLECCGWLPPPVDPVDLACARNISAIDCSFTGWNWWNETATVEGDWNLTAERADGSVDEVGRGMVPPEEYAPGTRREIRVTVPGLVDPSMTSMVLHIRLWRSSLPASVSESEATFQLIPPQS